MLDERIIQEAFSTGQAYTRRDHTEKLICEKTAIAGEPFIYAAIMKWYGYSWIEIATKLVRDYSGFCKFIQGGMTYETRRKRI